MSPLSWATKACARMCLMLVWLYQALILWWLACRSQMEWAHSDRFELIDGFCFAGNGQVLSRSAILEEGSARVLSTPTRFESFYLNPHAFSVSSRLQITSSFFNLSLGTFCALCCSTNSPICCHSRGQRWHQEMQKQNPLSCLSEVCEASCPGHRVCTVGGGHAAYLILLLESHGAH